MRRNRGPAMLHASLTVAQEQNSSSVYFAACILNIYSRGSDLDSGHRARQPLIRSLTLFSTL